MQYNFLRLAYCAADCIATPRRIDKQHFVMLDDIRGTAQKFVVNDVEEAPRRASWVCISNSRYLEFELDFQKMEFHMEFRKIFYQILRKF